MGAMSEDLTVLSVIRSYGAYFDNHCIRPDGWKSGLFKTILS